MCLKSVFNIYPKNYDRFICSIALHICYKYTLEYPLRQEKVIYFYDNGSLLLLSSDVSTFVEIIGFMDKYLNKEKRRKDTNQRAVWRNPAGRYFLCAAHNDTVVHYALRGLKNKVLASQYKLQLPDEAKFWRSQFIISTSEEWL